MIDIVRTSAEEAGRDPTTIEVTVQCNATGGPDVLAEVHALQEIGATRILVPAVLFGSDPQPSLTRYGRDVIEHA